MLELSLWIEPENPFAAGSHNQVAAWVLAGCSQRDRFWIPRIWPISTVDHLVLVPFLDPTVGKSPVPALATGEQVIQLSDRRAGMYNGRDIVRTAGDAKPQSMKDKISAD